mgnify:FL=1
MSEAAEQSQELRQLAEALLLARQNLVEAEKAAEAYAAAVKAGTAQVSIAQAAEIEANNAVAKARMNAAAAALQAEASGSAAAKRRAEAETRAAKAAQEAAENEARAVEDAEKRKAVAMAESASKASKLKELSVGALGGEETVERYSKAKEAIKLAGDASLGTGQRLLAGAAAAKFAASGIATLASGFAEFAAEARKASTDLYLHEQRVRSLGPAYDSIRAATSGAADIEANYRLKQELLARGFSATAEQASTLARAIREYARTQQVTQEQASNAITSALDGDAAAAGRFGVSIGNAATSSERFATITRQLADAQRGASVATQDVAERTRVQEEASGRAWSAIKKFAYEASGISTIDTALSDIVQGWDGLTRSTRTATQATQQLSTTERATVTQAQARQRAENERATAERRNAMVTLGSLNEELQRRGIVIESLGRTVNAEQAYGRARLDVAQATQRADETDTQFRQRKIELAQRLVEATQRVNAEAARQDGIRNTQAEIGLLAQQIRAAGGVVDARIRSITPAQRLLQLQRELANFAAREKEELGDTLARRQQLMQQVAAAQQAARQSAGDGRQRIREQDELARAARDLREETDLAYRLDIRIAEVEQRRGETGIEYINRRLEAQRALNAVDAEARDIETERLNADLAAAQDKEEQRVREIAALEYEAELERERARAAMNAAQVEQQRADQAENRLRESFDLAQERSRTLTQSMAGGAKAAYDAFGELGAGIAGAIKSATESGDDVGAAVAKQVDDWAAAKALQWGLQAAESLAGAGVAYFIRPDAVPGLLASAGMYAGLAAAAGITTAAIPNAPAASASGTAGGDRERGLGMASSMRSDSAATVKAQAPVVFNVSGFTSTESAQEGIVRALAEAQARGLISRSWQ